MGLTVGVIGLGRIGVMHARNAAQNPGVDHVVLIGRDHQRLALAETAVRRALAEDAPVHLRGRHAPEATAAGLSVRPLGAAWLEDLDGLVVATSTETHPDFTRQAVQAGVPVLVEKPLAMTPAELEELAEEFAEAQTPVLVAFHRRYDEGYQELRRRILGGQIGNIRSVRAIAHDHHHITEDYLGTSGGIWRDLVIHDLDVIPWLLDDEVVSVFATGAVLDDPTYSAYDDVDTATAVLTFASGVQATIAAGRSISDGHDVRTEVYGSDAALAAGLDAQTPIRSTEPGEDGSKPRYEEFTDRFEPAFRREVDHFLRVIRGEAVNLTPPEAGVRAMRLAVAAEESARKGVVVDCRVERSAGPQSRTVPRDG